MAKELKSKKLEIYFVNDSSIMVRPMERKEGRFVQIKHDKVKNIGKAITLNSTDEEIGKEIRRQYENCI